jgi:polar amino acid transport system permease protein
LYVLFPQVLRATIPAFTNQAIELLKNSALVSLIGLQDLTFVVQNIQIETYRYRESFIVVTTLYVALTFAIVGAMSTLQRRLRAR